jgi:uncharacterized membrane protein
MAITMMVVYHVVYDVDFLAPGLGPDPLEGGWGLVPEATASLFLLLAGVSFTISDARARSRGLTGSRLLARHARRAMVVIGAGMVVTGATLLAIPERYVRFGILHSIGVSLLLAPVIARLGRWCAPVGVAVIATGVAISPLRSDTPGLFVLGVRPSGHQTVDYWPLLPWLGVFTLGIALGRVLYPSGRRGALAQRVIGRASPPRLPGWVGAPGRRSLVIYLVHQPILIALITAVLVVAGQGPEWNSP